MASPVPATAPAPGEPIWPLAPHLVLQRLRASPLLTRLRAEHLGLLAAEASFRRYRRGEFVLLQDRCDGGFYLLLSGEAQSLRQGPQGRSLLLDRLTPGDHFGEVALIDGGPPAASVQCVATCELLMVPGQRFADCLAQSQALREALMQSLVARLRRSNRRITRFALHGVRARVFEQLHEMAEQTAAGAWLKRRVNRVTLARRVGASREMVSRVMSALESNGVVRTRSLGEGGGWLLAEQLPD